MAPYRGEILSKLNLFDNILPRILTLIKILYLISTVLYTASNIDANNNVMKPSLKNTKL